MVVGYDFAQNQLSEVGDRLHIKYSERCLDHIGITGDSLFDDLKN